jgi:hypothetical protein
MIEPGSESQRSNNMNTPNSQRSNNKLSHSQPSNNKKLPNSKPSNTMIESSSNGSNNKNEPDSKSQHPYLTEKAATFGSETIIGNYKRPVTVIHGRPLIDSDFMGSEYPPGRVEVNNKIYIVRTDASEYPGYDVPTDLKRFYIFEKAPFINLKTLTYRPYDAQLYNKRSIAEYYPFNDNDRSLADTLIDFMNMQELPIRSSLAKALTELFHDSPKKPIIYLTFTYTTAEDNHKNKLVFYGFDIIRFIEKYRDKIDLLDYFFQAMSFVRMKLYKGTLHYKGFVLDSMNRGNRSSRASYHGKKLKYQGMINCCINDNNNCTNKEPRLFGFGTRRKENPTLCTYASSPLNKPVTRTISSGGRRYTRHKRKTRRTRR